jgi:hypothetical protein
MTNLERLGDRLTLPMNTDEEGYFGRECPDPNCLGYFKIVPGTGVQGPAPCHCPYCGHTGDHDTFWTQEQLEYAESVTLNRIADAFLRDLKAMEFEHRPPPSGFGIGISLTVEGTPYPIRYYREERLETEVACDRCTLRYAIYGAFGFCPDCGVHNSHQVLEKNLELVEKQIVLVGQVDASLACHLIGNALEDAVSTFDGFGRETCRVRAASSTAPAQAQSLSFQNLAGAKQRLQGLFGVDLSAGVTPDEWTFACRSFQKRHLLAHHMGVVDEAYLQATADPEAVTGRKVVIRPDEVVALVALLRRLASTLLAQLPGP